MAASGWIPESLLDKVVVSRLPIPDAVRLANPVIPRAADQFGITKEIDTAPYWLAQAWAQAWRRSGFQGVRYGTRFTPDARPTGVALFGPAGVRPWPLDPAAKLAKDIARDAGLHVAWRPSSAALTIISPPTSGP
jgi:hypothetical protein